MISLKKFSLGLIIMLLGMSNTFAIRIGQHQCELDESGIWRYVGGAHNGKPVRKKEYVKRLNNLQRRQLIGIKQEAGVDIVIKKEELSENPNPLNLGNHINDDNDQQNKIFLAEIFAQNYNPQKIELQQNQHHQDDTTTYSVHDDEIDAFVDNLFGENQDTEVATLADENSNQENILNDVSNLSPNELANYDVDLEKWQEPENSGFIAWINSPELQNHWAFKKLCIFASYAAWSSKNAIILTVLYGIWFFASVNCAHADPATQWLHDKAFCFGVNIPPYIWSYTFGPLIASARSFMGT